MHRRRVIGRVGLALASASGWGVTLAAPSGTSVASASRLAETGAAADLADWMAKLQKAAASRSYQGTVTYSVGGTVSSARLQHHGDGRERVEKLEILDGRARLQYRHNDQTVTVWPESKLAVLEPADPVPAFPSVGDLQGLRPQEHYELKRGGSERVAGREAEVLLVNPRDAQRHGLRWWVDRESGLLLRSDTLGPQGEILESAAFTDLKLLPKPQPEAVIAAMRRLDGLRVVKPQPVKAQLEAEGWMLGRLVGGFQQRLCSRRPLDATADGPPTPVLQTIYSDGLAHVSLFIEPYDAGRHRQGMRTTMGATNTVMHRRGDWWITIVGEVPMATVLQFDSALERRR